MVEAQIVCEESSEVMYLQIVRLGALKLWSKPKNCYAVQQMTSSLANLLVSALGGAEMLPVRERQSGRTCVHVPCLSFEVVAKATVTKTRQSLLAHSCTTSKVLI